MSEVFLRLIREELNTAKLGSLPQQKYLEIEEHVNKAFLRVHELDELSLEVLQGVIKRLNDDLEKYAEIRILKSRSATVIPENTVDYDVIKAVIRLIEVEKHVLSPFVVRHADKFLYLFRKPCVIGERRFKKNDIVELSVVEMIVASIYECGEVLEKPIVKLIKSA